MKTISGLVMIFLFGAMFSSLFLMSFGMSMTGHMTDCSFMDHEQILCPMKLADYIQVWKATFLAVVSNSILLVLELVAISGLVKNPFYLLKLKWKLLLRWFDKVIRRIYTYVYRSFQELFSAGILNPKLY